MKMKKILIISAIVIFGVSFSGFALALTWNYTIDLIPNVSLTNDGLVPNSNNWYQLNLPSWYNSNYVTEFWIDMHGSNDDSSLTIDTWRKLGDASAEAKKIVGFNVTNKSRPFILRMNLMDMDLWYNYKNKSGGTWTGYVDTEIALNNIALANFDSLSSFLIGYACHFTYDKTDLHIAQTPVPEPATMFLLGSGLIGLAGYGRKKFFKR